MPSGESSLALMITNKWDRSFNSIQSNCFKVFLPAFREPPVFQRCHYHCGRDERFAAVFGSYSMALEIPILQISKNITEAGKNRLIAKYHKVKFIFL
jgi:hypothetical protein